MNIRSQILTQISIATLAALIAWPAAAQRPNPEDVPEPESPAVLAILETNPDTPDEWARAASILAGLGRPDLARGFLERIIKCCFAVV